MEQEHPPAPAVQPIQVKSNDKESVGQYRVVCYSKKDAASSGIKMAVVTFVAAVVSIVLPGVHFVSVPLGILASPFVGMYVYRTRQGKPKRMTADISCPECQAHNHVAASSITAYYECKCAHCQHDLRLTPIQAP